MVSRRIGLIACVLTATAAVAATGRLEVTADAGDYRLLRLELRPAAPLPKPADKADDGRTRPPTALYIGHVGGRLCQLWWVEAGKPLLPTFIQPRERDASGLTISDGGAAGVLRFAPRFYSECGQRRSHPPTRQVELTLDVTIAGGKLSGRFGWKVTGSVQLAASGTLTGRAWTGAQLRAAQGIADGQDYPCWRNLDGTGATADTGAELVESLDKARVLWQSEDPLAGSWGNGYAGHLGGYAPVVVAGGRVLAYYYRPTMGAKTTQIKLVGGRSGAWTDADRKRYSVAEADEVAVCIDAATGMTLWKRAFVGDGVNLTPDAKNGPFNPPCVAGGKLYVQGTRGQVYCLDAETGELVWRREGSTDLKRIRPITFGLQEADGVVLVGSTGGRAYGLDAATGKVRWGPGPMTSSSRGGGVVGPVRWTHKGKGYFVSSRRCVEAATGKECWKLPAVYAGCSFVAVSGDRLVVSTGGGRPDKWLEANPGKPYPTLACYRMRPDGVEKLWELSDRITGSNRTCPVIYKGHVFGASSAGKTDVARKCIFVADLATGKVVKHIADKGGAHCGWLAQNGRIFRQNGLRWYKADPADFRQLGSTVLPFYSGECLTPTLVDGRLLIRSNGGHLTCYDLRAD